MLRKIVDLFLLLGALTISAHAQLDVSITSLQTQPNGQKQITLHVQNNSGKDVAAYQVALTLKHIDGRTSESGESTDFGYRATRDGDPARGIPKLLVPGASYDDHVTFSNDVVDVTPKLTAVVYADRTARGDPKAIHEIVLGRKRFAEQLAKTAPAESYAAANYAKDDIRRLP